MNINNDAQLIESMERLIALLRQQEDGVSLWHIRTVEGMASVQNDLAEARGYHQSRAITIITEQW